MKQQTIKDSVSFSGIGLHSGRHVNVRVSGADEDTGILFVRTDLSGLPEIGANVANIVATNHATTLGADGATVATVEHLMAAFYGLGIDNAVVEIDGPEVPALDGSAAGFIDTMEAAGLKELGAARKFIVVKSPVKVADGGRYVYLYPAEDGEFMVDYTMDFSQPYLTKQTFSRLFTRELFRGEVAAARTFGFYNEVASLRAHGLALGGSLDNAVVIGESNILNKGGLRFPDEFVRHKVLDLIGDIALAGHPIIGRVVAHRAGHMLNCKLVQQLLKNRSTYELTEESVERSCHHEAVAV